MRYTMSIPEKLINQVRVAALLEGAERGEPMAVSEWIRKAMRANLTDAQAEATR